MFLPSSRRLVLAAVLCLAPVAVSAQLRDPNQPAAAGLGTRPVPLTRAEAGEQLLRGNPEIRIARAALEAATADIRRADVGPNPTLSASVSNSVANQYRIPGSERTLRLEQLFERGGKRELRVSTARHLEAAARQDLLDTIRQQRIALAAAYGDLMAAQRVEGFARDNTAGYRRLVDAAERRLRAGDLSDIDVARFRVEAARAEQESRAAEAATSGARIALAALLGVQDSDQLVASDDLPTLASADEIALPTPAAQLEAALDRRADAAAAKSRLSASARARDLAASQRTRDLLVGVQGERTPTTGGNVFGVSVSIPLLIGNDYSGEISRAGADLVLAEESLRRTRALIRIDVERAETRLSSARDRARALAGRALPEARRAAQGIEFAFSRGAASLTDLFDARRQLSAVQADAARALAEVAAAIDTYRETLIVPEAQ